MGAPAVDTGLAKTSIEAGPAAVRTVDVGQARADGRKRLDEFFLQSMLEHALPKSTNGVYGRGFSGEVARSWLAERLASLVIERGEISFVGRETGPGHAAAKVGSVQASGNSARGGSDVPS